MDQNILETNFVQSFALEFLYYIQINATISMLYR